MAIIIDHRDHQHIIIDHRDHQHTLQTREAKPVTWQIIITLHMILYIIDIINYCCIA